MEYPPDQVQELADVYGSVSGQPEAGLPYFLISGLHLPDGCAPQVTDALLCPMPRDGYASRLFFSDHITGPRALNWNAQNIRILERNWYAFSLQIREGMRLAQIVATFMSALVK